MKASATDAITGATGPDATRLRVEQLASGLVAFTADELAILQSVAALIERLAQRL